MRRNIYKKFWNQLGNSHGFSLIEMIMIIVIFGIGIYTLMDVMSWNMINSELSQTVTRSVLNAREKMDDIIAHTKSPARGYNWVVTPGRYASENLDHGFTRSVAIDTTGYIHNGISYARVHVRVEHADLPEYEITTWLVDHGL